MFTQLNSSTQTDIEQILEQIDVLNKRLQKNDLIIAAICSDILLTIALDGKLSQSICQNLIEQVVNVARNLQEQDQITFEWVSWIQKAERLSQNLKLDVLSNDLNEIRDLLLKKRNESIMIQISDSSEVMEHGEVIVILRKYLLDLRLAKESEDIQRHQKNLHDLSVRYKRYFQSLLWDNIIRRFISSCKKNSIKSLELFEIAFERICRFADVLVEQESYVKALTLFQRVGDECVSDLALIRSVPDVYQFDRAKLISAVKNVIQAQLFLRPMVKSHNEYNQNMLKYQQSLYKEMLESSGDVFASLERFSGNIQDLLKHIVKDIEKCLGLAPCRFALLVTETCSHKEMLPYSNLKFSLIVAETSEEIFLYFDALLKLFHFELESLDNGSISLVQEMFSIKNARVFGTSEQVVNALFDPNELMPKTKTDKIEKLEEMYPELIMGDAELLEQYRKNLAKRLKTIDPITKTPFNRRFVEAFLEDVFRDFIEKRNLVSDRAWDLKKDFGDYLTYPFIALALYHDIVELQPDVALSRMVNSQILHPRFSSYCKQLLGEFMRLRLKVQAHYQRDENQVVLPQSGMRVIETISKAYILTDQEYQLLLRIETHLLQPIYNSLIVKFRAGSDLKQFNPIEESFLNSSEGSQEVNDSKKHTGKMQILVGYLFETKANILEHRRCYHLLPAPLREEYLGCFKKIIEDCSEEIRVEEGRFIIDNLRQYPLKNGLRLNNVKRQEIWESELKARLTEPYLPENSVDYAKGNRFLIEWIENNKVRSGLLTKEIQVQLFDPQGAILKERMNDVKDSQSNMLVIQDGLQRYYYQIEAYPEFPGLKLAMNNLFKRLSGCGLTATVAKITNIKTTTCYPFLIYEPIAGKNLQVAFRENVFQEIEDCIDSFAFTWKVFESLLIGFEAELVDDLIAIPIKNMKGKNSVYIYGANNEHALAIPTTLPKRSVRNSKGVKNRNLMFCMEAMGATLDPCAIEEFLFLDPYLLLGEWLKELGTYNSILFSDPAQSGGNSLFSLDEIQKLAGNDDDSCFIPITFGKGQISVLHQRFQLLREALQRSKVPATHLDLLLIVEPHLGLYYEKAFMKHANAQDRFVALSGISLLPENKNKSILNYLQTSKHSEQVEPLHVMTNEIKPKIYKKYIDTRFIYGPNRANEIELDTLSQQAHKVMLICTQLLQGDVSGLLDLEIPDYIKEQVINGINLAEVGDRDKGEIEIIQKKILDAMRNIRFRKLCLRGFSVLDDLILKEILSNSMELIELDITDCSAITEIGLQSLEACFSLKKLSLKSLSKINQITFKRNELINSFDKLKTIVLEDCHNLNTVIIDIPTIAFISLRGCINLCQLEVLTLNLLVADLEGCKKLEQPKLDQMFKRSFLQDCITLPNGCEIKKLDSTVLMEAEHYFSRADYKNALLCYEKVLEKDPNNIFVLLRKGCTLHAKGEPDIATAYYYQAINLTSAQDVEDLWKRCIVNEKKKYLRFSQKTRENDDCFVLLSSYFLGLSRLYLLTGKFDLAEKILIKVKNLLQDRNKRDFQEACVLGEVGTYFLDSLNENISAKEYYERAVEILKKQNLQKIPLFIGLQVKLGDIASKIKNYPVAITRYEEAIGILSENEEDSLWVLEKLVKTCEAAAEYKKMLHYNELILTLLEGKQKEYAHINFSKRTYSIIKISLLSERKDKHYVGNCLRVCEIEYNQSSDVDDLINIATLGILFYDAKEYSSARLYFKKFLGHYITCKNPSEELNEKNAEVNCYLAQCYLKLDVKKRVLPHLEKAINYYENIETGVEEDILKVKVLMGEYYYAISNYQESERYYVQSLDLIRKLRLNYLTIGPFELAKLNLKQFSRKLGLDLDFDGNNTCIVGIDDEFSLHITYEPNSKRLYMYSPLLDGLPTDLEIKLKLYETLLQSSMLSAKTPLGGVGVNVEKELILIHCVLDMNNVDEYTLSEISSSYVELVANWRLNCGHIIGGLEANLPRDPEFVNGIKSPCFLNNMEEKVVDGLKSIQLKMQQSSLSETEGQQRTYEIPRLPSTLCEENARNQLREFGDHLGLHDLQFDENHTCVLGIDDSFSMHITYDPKGRKLFMYSPLLDGLPTISMDRLKLYEVILEGTMLGGQVAGGGAGVDTSSGLILLHFIIDVSPNVGSNSSTINKVAPLFVSTVEKWRKKCKEMFPSENQSAREDLMKLVLSMPPDSRNINSMLLRRQLGLNINQQLYPNRAAFNQRVARQKYVTGQKKRIIDNFSKKFKEFKVSFGV